MAFKSFSVINLVYSYNWQTKHGSNAVYYFPNPSNVGCFFCFVFRFLSPSIRRSLSTLLRRTVNKMSWSNPRQTRICYSFRLSVIIKALLKQISLYLLSHFHITIIVLTRPNNKSARNHQPKSRVPAKSHKSQWCEANIVSIELFAPF